LLFLFWEVRLDLVRLVFVFGERGAEDKGTQKVAALSFSTRIC